MRNDFNQYVLLYHSLTSQKDRFGFNHSAKPQLRHLASWFQFSIWYKHLSSMIDHVHLKNYAMKITHVTLRLTHFWDRLHSKTYFCKLLHLLFSEWWMTCMKMAINQILRINSSARRFAPWKYHAWQIICITASSTWPLNVPAKIQPHQIFSPTSSTTSARKRKPPQIQQIPSTWKIRPSNVILEVDVACNSHSLRPQN